MAPGPTWHAVLIVENDPQVRKIVERALDMEGYVTHTASNGAKGLQHFYLTLHDLIIMDLNMPEMDG